jgi:hypothetical protein
VRNISYFLWLPIHTEKSQRIGIPLTYVYQTKVGTRYFFLSPLPLVRYLEIVLPLRAGPLFSKIVSLLALVRYSATAIFSIVRWQRCH